MIHILEVACHRNGCQGEPFYAIRFRDGRRLFLGLVHEQPDRVVVIDPLMAAETVAAGTNSWRGDLYEMELREAVERFEDERTIPASQSRRTPLALVSNNA